MFLASMSALYWVACSLQSGDILGRVGRLGLAGGKRQSRERGQGGAVSRNDQSIEVPRVLALGRAGAVASAGFDRRECSGGQEGRTAASRPSGDAAKA